MTTGARNEEFLLRMNRLMLSDLDGGTRGKRCSMRPIEDSSLRPNLYKKENIEVVDYKM
jgi:hypothetical protein